MYVQLVKDMKNDEIYATQGIAFTFEQSLKYRNRATGCLLRKLNGAAFSSKMFKAGQLVHQRYYPEFHEWWNYIRDAENNDEVVKIIASEPVNGSAILKSIKNIHIKGGDNTD